MYGKIYVSFSSFCRANIARVILDLSIFMSLCIILSIFGYFAGLVFNGIRILDLASKRESRTDIEGDVILNTNTIAYRWDIIREHIVSTVGDVPYIHA